MHFSNLSSTLSFLFILNLTIVGWQLW
jgi:hypothetical protein